MYIYQLKEWPNFTWDQAEISIPLARVRHLQGKLIGKMTSLGFNLRKEANLETLITDVIKTSEIEGEKLDTDQVRSSIAKKLGIDLKQEVYATKDVEGIVEMMIDATQNFNQPLTVERLFDWHNSLFPSGRSGMQRINVGKWRDKHSGPMQVISGPIGKEKIHYEAPNFESIPNEINQFIVWFNDLDNDPENDLVIKAAISHFWFITIHPFEDGNGRIARAITDMVLAKSEESAQRFYSMSSQIQKDRKDYYQILESCQKGRMDITAWIIWFLKCLEKAILASDDILEAILTKAKFWKFYSDHSFNDRQLLMLNLILDSFKGNLTSSKWAKITKCSQDTALRDINSLLTKKVIEKDSMGGRSTKYYLNLKFIEEL